MLRHLMRLLGPSGQADTREAESQSTPDLPPSTSETVRDATVAGLTVSPKKFLIQALAGADGPLRQQELLERTDWSSGTLSKRLSALEEQGHIERFRLGREKVVCLPDEVPNVLREDGEEEATEDPTPGESTLLVAEDNPAERRLLAEALTECDPELSPIFVTEGPDVFDVLANEGEYAGTPPPALLILDMGLPKMDGKEILRRLRDRDEWRDLPVVILSNRNDRETIAKCYELGANAYYTKPDGYEELRAHVKDITESWLERPELPEAY